MLSLGLAIVIGGTVALCIGFLVVIILFGVKRYFAGSAATEKQRNVEVGVPGAEEKQEMEWDNSALNITINPLDDMDDDQMQMGAVAVAAAAVGRDADADSDDECNFDGCEASDEEKEMPRCSKELEWDNSTLTF